MNKGEFLAYKREGKGLSVSDLAEMLGVSDFEVERWEHGELPDSEHLLRLAQILGLTVEEILRGKESETSEAKRIPQEQESSYDGQRQGASETSDEEPSSDNGETVRNDADSFANFKQGGKYSHNGYYAAERKFGYFVFAVFLIVVVIMASFDFVGWVARPRELTADNCKDYVEVEIVPERNYNADVYFVRVTAKEDISDFSIVIKVEFFTIGAGKRYETVALQGGLKKGESLEQTVSLGTYALETGYEVVSAHGGLD